MKIHILYFSSLLFLIGYSSCRDKDDPYASDCFVPDLNVSLVVNMSLPEYFHLQNLGEYVYLQGGNRGVFLVHNYDDVFYALERTCTYKSDLDCSKIFVDSLNLRLHCGQESDTGFVACCSSKFQFSGLLTEGPARCNLKPYRVAMQNNTLYISN